MKLIAPDGKELVFRSRVWKWREAGRVVIGSPFPFDDDAASFGVMSIQQQMTNPPTTIGYELHLHNGVVVEG